jgi:hypothetical protein
LKDFEAKKLRFSFARRTLDVISEWKIRTKKLRERTPFETLFGLLSLMMQKATKAPPVTYSVSPLTLLVSKIF